MMDNIFMMTSAALTPNMVDMFIFSSAEYALIFRKVFFLSQIWGLVFFSTATVVVNFSQLLLWEIKHLTIEKD